MRCRSDVRAHGRSLGAEACAAALGQTEELTEFLEMNALIHDHPIPFIFLSQRSHPPTELRIDRLRALTDARSAPVAEPSAAVKGRPAGRLRRGLTARPLTAAESSAFCRLSGRQGTPCRRIIGQGQHSTVSRSRDMDDTIDTHQTRRLTTIGSSSLDLSVTCSCLPEAVGGRTLWITPDPSLTLSARRLAITLTGAEARWLAERLADTSDGGRP